MFFIGINGILSSLGILCKIFGCRNSSAYQQIRNLFFQMSVLFFAKLKGGERPFWKEQGGVQGEINPIALRFFKTLKKSVFLLNLKKSHPFLCCFLEPLTTKYCRVWRSVINFVNRFHEVGEESSLYQEEGLIVITSKREFVGDIMLLY